jgi:hypothetical protein
MFHFIYLFELLWCLYIIYKLLNYIFTKKNNKNNTYSKYHVQNKQKIKQKNYYEIFLSTSNQLHHPRILLILILLLSFLLIFLLIQYLIISILFIHLHNLNFFFYCKSIFFFKLHHIIKQSIKLINIIIKKIIYIYKYIYSIL